MARRRAAARVQLTGSQASGAWLKVVIGLVLALAIVFVLSQSRKAQLLESKTSAKVLSEPTDSPKPQSPEEPAAPEVPTDALQSEASGTHEVDADGSESTPTQ